MLHPCARVHLKRTKKCCRPRAELLARAFCRRSDPAHVSEEPLMRRDLRPIHYQNVERIGSTIMLSRSRSCRKNRIVKSSSALLDRGGGKCIRTEVHQFPQSTPTHRRPSVREQLPLQVQPVFAQDSSDVLCGVRLSYARTSNPCGPGIWLQPAVGHNVRQLMLETTHNRVDSGRQGCSSTSEASNNMEERLAKIGTASTYIAEFDNCF